MKAVFFHFNAPFATQVVRSIIRENGITEVHNFWPHKIADGTIEKSVKIVERAHESLELLGGQMKTIPYHELLPVDAELLRRLSPYEWDAKKIIARYSKISPELTKKKEGFGFHYIDKIARYVGYHYNSNIMPASQRDDIYNRMVRFWNDFFTNNKIDIVISELLPHGAMDYIGYRVAQLHNVPFVAGYFAHATLNMYLFEEYEKNRDDIRNVYERLRQTVAVGDLNLSQQSQNELKRIREKTLPYTGNPEIVNQILQKVQKPKPKRQSFLRNFAWIKAAVGEYRLTLNQLYDRLSVVPDLENTNFLYFPLSAQPEGSSLPIGGYYCNQLLIAELVTYYLPAGYQLFIKEHVFESDQEYRNTDFYQTLARNPRVVLVRKEVNTFELIKRCKAVVTIASTASWEGLHMGKPCLFFGYHITQYAPGIFPVRTREDCSAAMKQIEKGYEVPETDMLYFMKALEEVCAPTAVDQFVYGVKTVSDEEWTRQLSDYFKVNIDRILTQHRQRHGK